MKKIFLALKKIHMQHTFKTVIQVLKILFYFVYGTSDIQSLFLNKSNGYAFSTTVTLLQTIII